MTPLPKHAENFGSFKLAPWVRTCATGEFRIFLDLKANRYYAARADLSEKKLLEELSALGVLERDAPSKGWRIAKEDVTFWQSAPDIWAIADAGLWARRIVRRGRLDDAFSWIRSAKARVSHDLSRTQQSVLTFERLRVWFPHAYACLFDSLALMRYLARRQLAADLVFGVRGMPFAAHCWVECGDEILDTGGEDCASFTEIARV